ncbi:MAG: aldo/keto reductase [Planctomycetota bacterium]|nr:aldo/keto reductase [Planctomycetota bacterium]MDA1177548.1 aldo/keto reductase [Planctomycetota bacterium]
MKYRYLGKSGLLVSRICLGTMTFGMADWGCGSAEATAITRRFLEAGGNFIDTADMYSVGISEEITGQAIRDWRRDELVLASKCWFRMNKSPNAKGLSRKHILEAVEASLQRLGTDYLDLYQVHGPDPFTPMEETMHALDRLVSSGKVRYLGCSNYFGWQIAKANGIADRQGWCRFVSGQHMYNLLRRDVEREILPACADQGMGLMCWSPLAGGMLTGKYSQESGPSDTSRVGLRKTVDLPRYWHASSFQMIDEVQRVAQEVQRTPSQLALAWLLHDQRVTSVILGSKTVEQMESGLVAGDWDIDAESRRRLSNAVPFSHGYPQDWIDNTWQNIAGQEEFAPPK